RSKSAANKRWELVGFGGNWWESLRLKSAVGPSAHTFSKHNMRTRPALRARQLQTVPMALGQKGTGSPENLVPTTSPLVRAQVSTCESTGEVGSSRRTGTHILR